MKHTEFYWLGPTGQKVYAQCWQPKDQDPKAVICLVHGMGEHSSRYLPMANYFEQHNIAVLAFDQLGHGQTEGKRGHVNSYDELLDQVERLITESYRRFPKVAKFLYGHSMGGNLVTNYVLRRQAKIAGAIVSAPWLKLAFDPPAIKVKLGQFTIRFLGTYTEKSNLNTKHLSQDTAVVTAYENDPLIHDKISVRMFVTCHEAGLWALERAATLEIPMLLMHGDSDKITSHQGSQLFAERASNDLVTFKSWPNMYHEIHNEPDKIKVWQTTLEWIEQNSPSKSDQ